MCSGLERLTNLAVRTQEKGPGIKSQHSGRTWWTKLNVVSLYSVHHSPEVSSRAGDGREKEGQGEMVEQHENTIEMSVHGHPRIR